MQELLFRDLVFLFRNGNGDIQKATREALLRIKVSSFISYVITKDEKIEKYQGSVFTKATNDVEILINPLFYVSIFFSLIFC